MPSTKKSIDSKLRRQVRDLLHRDIADGEYPGGRSRDSFRVILKDGRSVIASRRKDVDRARLERTVLRKLSKAQAPVPKFLAGKNRLLFQQDLGNQRLSQALATANTAQTTQLLQSSLDGLSASQQAASAAGLDAVVPARGHERDWMDGLLERPLVIGKHFNIPAPTLDYEKLADQLALRRARFVKWDARPGNALVDDSNSVFWIDWEHCGSRNRLDDMAWLLADEYVDDSEAIEQPLLEKTIGDFADGLSVDEAQNYLMTYGAFHSVVRLGLILRHKKDDDWWDPDYCLDKDKVGITLACAQRLCRRGSRWSGQSTDAHALSDWFSQINDHLSTI